MSSRGVSISSLLSSAVNDNKQDSDNGDMNPPVTSNGNNQPVNLDKPSDNDKSKIKNLVSMFQPNIKVGGPDSPLVIIDDDVPKIQQLPQKKNVTTVHKKENVVPPVSIAPKVSRPQADISKQIKQFQTEFQFENPNKVSISSIMNNDDTPTPPIVQNPPQSQGQVPSQGQPLKPATIIPRPNERKSNDKSIDKEKTPKKKSPAKRKAEPKKASNTKKAKVTPEPAKPEEVINLPPPVVIDVEEAKIDDNQALGKDKAKASEKDKTKDLEKDKGKGIEKEAERDKDKDKDTREPPKELELSKKEEIKELPIIALNIPLLDPKKPRPGKAEVVVNVLKLAEDKYGWSTIHPNAKSALEVMDGSSDDDLEEDDDDDDKKEDGKDKEKEKEKEEEKQKEKDKEKKELTEEQLIRQHETRMNRKVGKYDYLDPFIDDNELELEEGITSTKEGFFVYWGPIVDDRNNAKKSSKGKRL